MILCRQALNTTFSSEVEHLIAWSDYSESYKFNTINKVERAFLKKLNFVKEEE